MQLALFLSILLAVAAVMFAVQNNVPVTVSFALWSFDSSLALLLMVTLAFGVLMASLLSTPSVMRKQGEAKRLRRKLAALQQEKAELEQRLRKLEPPAPDSPAAKDDTGRNAHPGLQPALLHKNSIQ